MPVDQFQWRPQPLAAAMVHELVESFCQRSASIARLRDRLLHETGTRLVDWVDHFVLPDDHREETFRAAGFTSDTAHCEAGYVTLVHEQGMFPRIRIDGSNRVGSGRLFLLVDAVEDYLKAHGAIGSISVAGCPGGQLRQARVVAENDVEQWVIERHGDMGFAPAAAARDAYLSAVAKHRQAFAGRRREFDDPAAGFVFTQDVIEAAVGELGTGRASHLFFAAERDYWQSRNKAAQLQRRRQDAMGLGWANHDHHTYRSSRACFSSLIAALEALGCRCRERFYAGREAGWGAQALEHPETGIVIFADVDLSPEEVSDDFAHNPLAERGELGTVGLWCRLHGEAFLQAGLHHLECQFDFDAAREQLAAAGVPSMAPFTDFPFLKQAFTQGEIWPVSAERIDSLRNAGLIDDDAARRFAAEGALGSHLEILERNDGYKGFNQTGISEIILRTDPRACAKTHLAIPEIIRWAFAPGSRSAPDANACRLIKQSGFFHES